jgi:FLVCR family MFS transporter
MNVGQMLNGLAGPLAMAGPPAVSAVWFPPEERTRATAIGTFFAMMGTAAGFLIGKSLNRMESIGRYITEIR